MYFSLTCLITKVVFKKNDNRTNAVVNTQFRGGTGTIVYDDLVCTGSEEDLLDCQYLGPDKSDCDHSEDVGVTCGKHKVFNGILLCFINQ